MPVLSVTLPRRWRFVGVAFALAVLALGSNEPSALYQVYARRFGFLPLTTTLIFAIYCVALLPALITSGRVLDHHGPRTLGALGLGLTAAGSAIFATAAGTAWLYVARAVQGVAVGTATGALTACLVATEPAGDGPRASRVAAMVLCGGAGLGPVVAGATATWLAAPAITCYLLEIGLVILAVPFALAGVTAPTAPRGAEVTVGIDDGAQSTNRRTDLLTASVISALAWAVAAVFLALVPSFASRQLETHNLAITGAAAGLLLLAASAVQPVARYLNRAWGAGAGLGLLAVGCLLLLGASARTDLALLLAAATIAGAGQGLAFAASLTQAAFAASRSGPGRTWAMFYTITYLGEAGPVIAIGVLANHLGLVSAVRIFLTAATIACVALAIPVITKRHQQERGCEHRWRH